MFYKVKHLINYFLYKKIVCGGVYFENERGLKVKVIKVFVLYHFHFEKSLHHTQFFCIENNY